MKAIDIRSKKLSYEDQLHRKARRAIKAGNESEARYYLQNIGTTSACVSYERWIGSQAGKNWLAKNSHTE